MKKEFRKIAVAITVFLTFLLPTLAVEIKVTQDKPLIFIVSNADYFSQIQKIIFEENWIHFDYVTK